MNLCLDPGKSGQTYDVVIRGVQGFEQTSSTPAASEHNQSFLLGVEGHLCTWVLILLRNIVEGTSSTNYCDEGCTAEDLEEIPPFGL